MSSEDWRKEAVCATTDPELFFARGQHFEAKAICVHCPIKQECLTEALGGEIEYGVWGGLSAPERLELLRAERGEGYRWPSPGGVAPLRSLTHCAKAGHELTGDNIRVTAEGLRCRACLRALNSEAKARSRAKGMAA